MIPSSAEESASASNKRKTALPFFNSRLIYRFRAVVVRGTSVYRSLPHFCFAKMRDRFAKVRHGIRAVCRADFSSSALVPLSGRCGVSPPEGAADDRMNGASGGACGVKRSGARGRLPPLKKPNLNDRAITSAFLVQDLRVIRAPYFMRYGLFRDNVRCRTFRGIAVVPYTESVSVLLSVREQYSCDDVACRNEGIGFSDRTVCDEGDRFERFAVEHVFDTAVFASGADAAFYRTRQVYEDAH